MRKIVLESYIEGSGGLLAPVDCFDPVRLIVVDGHDDFANEVGVGEPLVAPRVFEDVKSSVFADNLRDKDH